MEYEDIVLHLNILNGLNFGFELVRVMDDIGLPNKEHINKLKKNDSVSSWLWQRPQFFFMLKTHFSLFAIPVGIVSDDRSFHICVAHIQ